MIIKRLTLHNFGVYAGTNEFLFKAQSPIVLIGGMNGRGKTTFLEAILLSLYGPNSFAYKESTYKSYGQYLRSYVNKNDWSLTTYIELDFIINVGNRTDEYVVHREWDALTRWTKESISVMRNGEVDPFLTDNWIMYVEDILPSALSNFFFFDGEKIAELAVDSTGEQVKQSIRALLGITVLDTLKSDLGRVYNRVFKEKNSQAGNDEVTLLENQKNSLQKQINDIDQELTSKHNEITRIKIELEELHNEYIIKGGDIQERKQEILEKKNLALAKIAHNEERLREIAAGILPLVMVKSLVQDIKLQAEDEHDAQIMSQSIDRIKELFDEYRKSGKTGDPEFIAFLSGIASRSSEESVYNLSDHALYQVSSLVEEGIDSSKTIVKNILSENDQIAAEIKTLDSYLSSDINETEILAIKSKTEELNLELILLDVTVKNLEQQRSTVNGVLIRTSAEYNRCLEEYIKNLEISEDDDRILKYTHLADRILSEFTVRLQSRKVDLLAETITACYKQLANKKNMISKVVMDPTTLELSYQDENGAEVVKTALSAGEQQLMVISILWALAKCSKKKLPVIIDTPLSRLDSAHREALVNIYFPQASEQTIILSTDSEIDERYYHMMRDHISDEFILVYNDETKSTAVKAGYFIGESK